MPVGDATTSNPMKPAQPRLLLVDDDANAAFFVRRALRKSGVACAFHHATSPVAALDYLRSVATPPTHILLDIRMPFMTGWDLLDYLEEHDYLLPSDTEIVMCSSSGHPDDIARACDYARVSDYFQKPFLASQVEPWLGAAAA